MNDRQYIEKYGLKTAPMIAMSSHVCSSTEHNINNPPEYNNIVVSTNTMNTNEWVQCRIWGYAVIAGHFYGLTHIISRFLHKKCNISYKEFYYEFTEWHLHNTTDNRFGRELLNLYDDLLGVTEDIKTLNVEILTKNDELSNICWKYEESTFIHGYLDRKNFFTLLKTFIHTIFQSEICKLETSLLDEVLLFNKLYMVDHTTAYPISHEFNYNLDGYIFNDEGLQNTATNVVFDSKNYDGNLRSFCVERAWYARQQGGGRAQIKYVNHIKKDPVY